MRRGRDGRILRSDKQQDRSAVGVDRRDTKQGQLALGDGMT